MLKIIILKISDYGAVHMCSGFFFEINPPKELKKK